MSFTRSYSGSSRNAKHPVARRFRRSFWTIRRKQQQHPVERLFESAVAIYSVASYSVQSQEIQAQRFEEVAKRSSRGDKLAAKQLTNYRRVGCQLLSLIQMKKATEACKRKGRKYCSCVGTLQRSVALKWKEDKIAFWSAEQVLEAFQREEFYRGYIFEATPIEEVFV
ncbi:hypothetical protein F511_45839 [Dorcoceras hygrometricum]|uniref:Uncharacterized protein n=1 Tax=Dorcoceras hygrometricum TaxID=472368 RepID=A0A2Z6ZV32_9LAMI|nr:hypothetical protein F511_45839 [Dorcoceras hygrometricum]